MKSKGALFLMWCLLGGVMACSQPESPAGGEGDEASPVESAERVSPNIPGVVAAGTVVRTIGNKFETGVIEGPVALPDGSLLFSERDKGRTWKLDKDDNLSIFAENPNTGQLGLGFDSRGRLIAVQTLPMERAKIAVIYPDSEKTVLADNFEGKALGRPNDLVVDKKDGVYFTAPATTPQQIKAGYPPTTEPVVYYLPAGGQPIPIASGIARPNGIQLSTDEKTLYVNDSLGEYMLAFDIQPDGTVRNRRNFAQYQGVDRTGPEVVWPDANGLAIDSENRVYAVTESGVQVFNPQGQYVGTIPTQEGAENVAFAGPDKKTLYIVGGSFALKVETLAQGFQGRAK